MLALPFEQNSNYSAAKKHYRIKALEEFQPQRNMRSSCGGEAGERRGLNDAFALVDS